MNIRVRGGIIKADRATWKFLSAWSWSINKKGYVVAGMSDNGKKFTARFHRIAIGAQPGEIVDHVNGDRLDNRWANLRVVTASQNCRNRYVPMGISMAKGVSRCAKRNKWRAIIYVDKRNMFLGRFDTIEEASSVYREAEIKYYKQYGRKEIK